MRYLVFGCMDYYPDGGCRDLVGRTNELSEAIKALVAAVPKYDKQFDEKYVYDSLNDLVSLDGVNWTRRSEFMKHANY